MSARVVRIHWMITGIVISSPMIVNSMPTVVPISESVRPTANNNGSSDGPGM